jgi:hypothetical protein
MTTSGIILILVFSGLAAIWYIDRWRRLHEFRNSELYEEVEDQIFSILENMGKRGIRGSDEMDSNTRMWVASDLVMLREDDIPIGRQNSPITVQAFIDEAVRQIEEGQQRMGRGII